VSNEDAHETLTALARAEARRARTPGVKRWFVVLSEPELPRQATTRIRVPRLP
jgi:hypothetical protein